jgi:hypothetical protein
MINDPIPPAVEAVAVSYWAKGVALVKGYPKTTLGILVLVVLFFVIF